LFFSAEVYRGHPLESEPGGTAVGEVTPQRGDLHFWNQRAIRGHFHFFSEDLQAATPWGSRGPKPEESLRLFFFLGTFHTWPTLDCQDSRVGQVWQPEGSAHFFLYRGPPPVVGAWRVHYGPLEVRPTFLESARYSGKVSFFSAKAYRGDPL
jgi:hypothetical protein